MKTDIVSELRGALKVSAKYECKSTGTLIRTAFPMDTLFDWYPLNIHYSYQFNERDNLYYLVADDEASKYPRYGVYPTKEPISNKKAHMDKSLKWGEAKWYNKYVAEDNRKVFAFAKSMGVITPEETYTEEEVDEGLAKVQTALDYLYRVSKDRLDAKANYSSKTLDKRSCVQSNGETFYEYNPKSEEPTDVEQRALAELTEFTPEEEELYVKLGEVYVMLILMKKITLVKG